MNNKRITTLCLASSLLLTFGAAITPPAAATTSNCKFNESKVSSTIESYVKKVDSEWLENSTSNTSNRGPNSSNPSALTSTEQINQRVRDAISTQGIRVASASSKPQIVNISCQTDGKIAVTTEISTTFTFNYEGYGTSETPGIKSDQHVLTLSVDSSDYSVLEDKITSHEEVATPGDTPPEYDPTISNSDHPEAGQTVESSGTSVGGGTTSGTPLILPAYNTVSPDVSAMQQYALKWTSPPYDGDEKKHFNPEFDYWNNNCANFVSQVLHAGGWSYDDWGVNPHSTKFWGPDLLGPAGASRTWTYSASQYTYVKEGAYTPLDNIWNAKPGDLLYVDWDPDGKADGLIDHVMVVTGSASRISGTPLALYNEPLISQKTPNRSNLPLSLSIKFATEQQKTDIKWYGLQRES